MSNYKKYPKYRDSGVEWLGEVPESWEVKKLKFIAYAKPSNVDKKSKDSEKDVLLCNYTDVYYNDFITNDIEFMKATATDEQIKKFTLEVDDVIITKDSEGPEDIAIATCVQEVQDNLICGYHLTHIKPTGCNGRYLFRAFNSDGIHDQFKVAANGITRYGLGVYGIDNAWFPLPPLQEQQTIANYLDKATTKIDTLIEKQTRLIELLKEKRQAVISATVTRGLDSTVAMKDSGVEWLGEIPVHWDTVAMKLILDIRDGTHDTPSYIDDGLDSFPLVTSKDFVDNSISFSKTKYISKKDHILIRSRSKVDNGDVLMSMIGGNIGKSLIANVDREISIKNVALFKTSENPILAQLLLFYLDSYLMSVQIDLQNRGGAQGFLSLGDIRNLVFPKIPLMEQKAIVTYLTDKTSKIDNLITKSTKAIDLLKEKRTALISAVVTGKIDVRGFEKDNIDEV